jgi:hypothetical protein
MFRLGTVCANSGPRFGFIAVAVLAMGASTAWGIEPTLDGVSDPGSYTHDGGLLALPRLQVDALIINSGTIQITPKAALDEGDGTSVLKSLLINGGALDLTNNALILDYSSESPLTAVQTMIRRGFGSGNGIVSQPHDPRLRVGYADNSVTQFDCFGEAPVDSTSVLITSTYAGDANLDGVVDLRDLAMLSSGWRHAGTWASGDFNYDGIVNAQDLGLLASNWQAGLHTAVVDPGLDDLLVAFGFSGASVPEPASACVIAMGAMLAARRRRT